MANKTSSVLAMYTIIALKAPYALTDFSEYYLVIRLHADIHGSGEPFVSMVLLLSPNSRLLPGRCPPGETQLVHVEPVHVVVERDAMGSSAVQARNSDATTTEWAISDVNSIYSRESTRTITTGIRALSMCHPTCAATYCTSIFMEHTMPQNTPKFDTD